MKNAIAAFMMALGLFAQTVRADERPVIEIPPEIKTMFLEEMRTHLDNLNEITLAISAGDFKNAAFVAQHKMRFGRSIRDVMMGQGKTQDEITHMIATVREKYGDGEQSGEGMIRYMPAEVHEMGILLQGAAENLARVANSVKSPPTVADYQRVFTALSETIDVCSACHSSFRVK